MMSGGAMMSPQPAGAPEIEGKMPELAGATGWLNSKPLTREGLRGKVVVIDFWTYSCINCLRAIPYVNAWYRHYKDAGLVIIGVHSPEFAFEKDTANVRQAVEKFKISYPVALDSDMAVWKAFNNRFWPAHYFVDAQGKIRGHHFGEGKYARSERTIRNLLTEAGVENLPDPLDDAAGEGVSAAADSANVASPETYLGFQRAENFQSPGSFARNGVKSYELPARLALNQWALGGRWKVSGERSALEAAPGRIVFRFRARDLHLVLGPGAQNKTNGKPVRFECCSMASRRAPITAWTSTRREPVRCASSGCTSSSARRAPWRSTSSPSNSSTRTSRHIHSRLVRSISVQDLETFAARIPRGSARARPWRWPSPRARVPRTRPPRRRNPPRSSSRISRPPARASARRPCHAS